MGRGQRAQATIAQEAVSRRQPKTRVALFGGQADGWLIDIEGLPEEIAVYRGPSDELTALELALANGIGGQFLGVYAFVGPRGPEAPTYVNLPGRSVPG